MVFKPGAPDIIRKQQLAHAHTSSPSNARAVNFRPFFELVQPSAEDVTQGLGVRIARKTRTISTVAPRSSLGVHGRWTMFIRCSIPQQYLKLYFYVPDMYDACV
jgi:hypothetical protein